MRRQSLHTEVVVGSKLLQLHCWHHMQVGSEQQKSLYTTTVAHIQQDKPRLAPAVVVSICTSYDVSVCCLDR